VRSFYPVVFDANALVTCEPDRPVCVFSGCTCPVAFYKLWLYAPVSLSSERRQLLSAHTHTHTLTHYPVHKHAQRHQVEVLAAERRNWLFSPDALIRAARHYESAAQILISHAVMTAQKFVRYVAAPPFANSDSVSRCYTLVLTHFSRLILVRNPTTICKQYILCSTVLYLVLLTSLVSY
jgi:hypothetical protein